MMKLGNIYRLSKDLQGFGDIWAATNYILSLSMKTKTVIKIADPLPHQKEKMMTIEPHLEHEGAFTFVKNKHSVILSYYIAFKRFPFLNTKIKWNGDLNFVAYQFDGRHRYTEKNPPMEDQKYFVKECRKYGLVPINLGGNKDLDFVIKILSFSKAFVGCISGISKVAISMRLPIFAVRYNLPSKIVTKIKNCQFYNAKKAKIYENLIQISEKELPRLNSDL